MNVGRNKQGFTIVELLIVVVVIAILAAITIIAYSGIRDRTLASAAQSNVSQTGKKVQTYMTLHGDLAPTEATYSTELALPNSTPSTTYDYFVSDSQKSFCISITDTTKQPELAYAFTNSGGGVVQGRCVRNLVTNPSFETLSSGLPVGVTASSRATAVTSSTGVLSGTRSVAVTPIYASSNDTFVDMANWGIQPNTSYTVGMQVTVQQALPTNTRFRFNVGGIDSQSGGFMGVGTHQINWQYNVTAAAPLSFLRFMPGGKQGDPTVYIDNFMVTTTSSGYRYGDGDSANWSWGGAAHASTSFGPALPL